MKINNFLSINISFIVKYKKKFLYKIIYKKNTFKCILLMHSTKNVKINLLCVSLRIQ